MKVSDQIIQEIESGNTSVVAIANKLNITITSITSSLPALKKKGYSYKVVDGELCGSGPSSTETVSKTEEIMGIEYTEIHEIQPSVIEDVDNNVTNMVIEVSPDTTMEVSTSSKTRGRKTNLDSTRQRAFALIREMMDNNEKRKDIKNRLVTELGLKEGNAGIYIQKIRDERWLVKQRTKQENSINIEDVVVG